MKDIRRSDFLNAAMTSRSHSSIREMLIAVLLFFAGTIIGSIIQAPALFVYFLNNKEYMEMVRTGSVSTNKILDMVHNMPDWTVAMALCASIGVLAVVIVYCRLVEKRKAYSIGFTKKSCVFSYFAGIFLGFLMISFVYAAAVFSGGIEIHFTFQKDAKPALIALFFVGFLIEGMAEEVLCRGFLLVSLTKRYTVFFSLVISSVFYAFFRGFNSELSFTMYLNLILFGYFMGLLFLRFENIWFVGAFHGIWNFFQTNIVGEYEENAEIGHSLFSTTYIEGRDIIHGGAIGIEGGMMVTVILLLGIVILTLEMRHKGMFVNPKPVENPYDAAYYKELQDFFREHGGSSFGAFREDQKIYEKKEQMPVNEEMIMQAEKQHIPPAKEEQVKKTEFDQNYFKS